MRPRRQEYCDAASQLPRFWGNRLRQFKEVNSLRIEATRRARGQEFKRIRNRQAAMRIEGCWLRQNFTWLERSPYWSLSAKFEESVWGGRHRGRREGKPKGNEYRDSEWRRILSEYRNWGSVSKRTNEIETAQITINKPAANSRR
jgi:hypothetical protein